MENMVQYKLHIYAYLRYTNLFGRNVRYFWEYMGIYVAPPPATSQVLSICQYNSSKSRFKVGNRRYYHATSVIKQPATTR
jgi:hypothetical protein